uniref:Kinesin-like protein n=1 Tax=Latimeria chalumnae TaxID=7897 RepID=H3BCP2_LATCH
MAEGIFSPAQAVFSDEEEAPVLESTAADLVSGIRKDLLTEFSVISPGIENAQQEAKGSLRALEDEKVKVYLRIRPFTELELEKGEDQGCVTIENPETLILRAPKDSFNMKSTERGIGQAVHKFTFSRIFSPENSQKQFFDATMKDVVKDVLEGENCLVYTYGVTNSGKTFTVQGTSRDAGILPRSLAIIFNSLQGKLYQSMDLKPSLSNEVIWLDSKQVRTEEMKKNALLARLREDELQTSLKRSESTDSRFRAGTSCSFDSGIGGLSCVSQLEGFSYLETTTLRFGDPDVIVLEKGSDTQYSVWVSFFEIYNEFIYDLLDMVPLSQNRKRQTLKLSEDKNGNPYIKDLNWINVSNAEEAWKLLKTGRKNQSFASTHLNHNSSRSHSVFSIRILHLNGVSGANLLPHISELSLCDLAGSERCKDQKIGERLKEATNINASLHTLGRCIGALRQNQQQRMKQNVVPFRDSKLTRVFQGFFSGRGKSYMIVNINQCASTYDETLHVIKFSAVASQLVHAPPGTLRIASIRSLLRGHSAKLSQSLEDEEEEEEEEDDSDDEDEDDMTTLNREELLNVIETLKDLLIKEKHEKLTMELEIRNEVCKEVLEQMQKRENEFSERLETEKELLEEMYENKMNNLKECLTNYYQQEIQERDDKIEELEILSEREELESKKVEKNKTLEQSQAVRRSQRIACATNLQQEELMETKGKLITTKAELDYYKEELNRYRQLMEPPPSAKSVTLNVDRKLEEGQKSIRVLRLELKKLGESLQSAERACCRRTSAEKLRQTLNTCDEILTKQNQTLAELQNNMVLVKMDLRKKNACIAEQYHTVQKLQESPAFSKKRVCADENMYSVPPPEKKPFLRNLFSRTPGRPALIERSPYNGILRTRKVTPVLKSVRYGVNY